MTDCPAPSPFQPPHPFTAPERELIRRELGRHFGQLPSVADGLFLRTWRGGPQAGQPKLPPMARQLGLQEALPAMARRCHSGLPPWPKQR